MESVVHPECMQVDTPVEVRVMARLDEPLTVGDTIAFALPESWSSQRGCVTYPKEPQIEDPGAPDHVAVVADGVEFELSVERVLFASGHMQTHPRKVVGRLVSGELRAGDCVTLELRNLQST